MDFVESQEMKIKLNEEDRAQLSSSERISQALKNREALAFDIFESGDLIGFAMVRPFARDGFFIWNFAIDDKWQGKGYGRKALLNLISLLREEYHAVQFTITYSFGNSRAKHLYEKVGFQETNTVNENGIHEVNMRLEFET